MPKFFYGERLSAIDISSLKYCQLLVKMIQMYKTLNSDGKSIYELFKISSGTITRGHNLKIQNPFA